MRQTEYPDKNDFAETLAERMGAFARWGAFVSLFFFSIYPTTNWLAANRGGYHSLYFDAELRFPFLPEFVWLYLSMYVLFLTPPFFLDPGEMRSLAKRLAVATVVSGIVFIIFPVRLGFARIVPDDGPYRAIFEAIHALDLPFNLVPSLHVVYTFIICLAIARHAGKTTKFVFSLWGILIALSTVLVQQHHLVDVFAGVALALSMNFFQWKEDP